MRLDEIRVSPNDRTFREFAGGLVVVCAGLATWLGWSSGNLLLFGFAAGAALLVAGVGVLRPRLLAPLFWGWMIVVFPVAWLVSHLILVVLFFGMITPVAVLFRLVGRDALNRKLRPEQATYWEEKPTISEATRYLRQF